MSKKTQRQIDFEATRDFWIWETENGLGHKYYKRWQDIHRIQHLIFLSACCEYNYDNRCVDCFLLQKLICDINPKSKTTYWYWHTAILKKTRKKYAAIIRDAYIEYYNLKFEKRK